MIVKNVEKKENNTASFQVESDKAEFESAVNKAYQKNKGKIFIPGFRKGKAPRTVIEGMYGTDVFYEDAIDDMAPEAFEFGIKASGLKMVGRPILLNVNVTDERTLECTFGIDLYPVVTLGEYKGIEVEKQDTTVTDDMVNDEIESVRKRNARMITVEDRAAQMGDTANIDYEGFLNGEPFDGGKDEGHDLELGSNSFVPGFEEQVVGMNIGDEKELNITFPDNYAPDLAGKDVVFKVKLNGLTYAELPELDDDFAQDVSEFDTLAQYKDNTRATLEKNLAEQADYDFRNRAVEIAAGNITVDIPKVMIDDEMENIIRNYATNFGINTGDMSFDQLKKMMGFSDEFMQASVRPMAELQIKMNLMLEAVADSEGIALTDENKDEYLNGIADSTGASVDELIEYFGMEYIEEQYKHEQASKFIADNAVAVAPKAAEESEEAPAAEGEEKAE